MKLKPFIAIVLLAVYSLVFAHSFIPHHHHSEIQECTHHCYFAEHQHVTSECGNFNNHSHSAHHLSCHFNGKIIPAKVLSLSVVYFMAEPAPYNYIKDFEPKFTPTHKTPLKQEILTEFQGRRGPPQFV